MFSRNIKISLLTSVMLMLFSVSNVWAIDLDSAKRDGLVGEQANGYLGIVSKPANSEVESLVRDVNERRRSRYMEIAQKNSLPLPQVETQAGQMLIEKTSAGHYVNSTGSWQKK